MTFATRGLDFASGSSAERMGVNDEAMPQFTIRKNLDPLKSTPSQTRVAQSLFVNNRSSGKFSEGADVDGKIRHPMTGIVESALGNASD